MQKCCLGPPGSCVACRISFEYSWPEFYSASDVARLPICKAMVIPRPGAACCLGHQPISQALGGPLGRLTPVRLPLLLSVKNSNSKSGDFFPQVIRNRSVCRKPDRSSQSSALPTAFLSTKLGSTLWTVPRIITGNCMCGIFAIHGLEQPNAQRSRAIACSKKLRHRGPDWSGCYVGKETILVHERLAIVGVGAYLLN